MAALIGNTRIRLKDITTTVTVPDAAKARLMYYLKSNCSITDVDNSYQLRRLGDYDNHGTLTDEETDKLVLVCFMVSPDELEDKCIFNSDAMCGDSGNKFFELSTVRNHLLVASSIIIGGQRKQVKDIMTYKMSWMNRNYFEPMRFDEHLRRVLGLQRRQPQRDCMFQ